MQCPSPTEPFECKACGTCCRWPGYVYLTDHDIAALAKGLDLTQEQFIEKYTTLAPNRSQLCLNITPDAPCLFLDGDSCRVYSARPRQCRDYPATWNDGFPCPGFG